MLLNRPRAAAIMRESGIDCLIASDPQNVAYMSDYFSESSRGNRNVQVYGLVPADEAERLTLVVPSLEVDAWAEAPGWIDDVVAYGTFYRALGSGPLEADERRIVAASAVTATDAIAALAQALTSRALDASTLGVDESNLTPELWRRLAEALPRARLVPAAGTFAQVRMVKTDDEVARMRRSAEISEEALRRTWAETRAGMTEIELATRFRIHVTELGGEPAFWIINVGRRTGHTHNRPSDARIGPGDLMKFDVGCRFDWYWSDVGRTKSLGSATARHQKAYGAIRDGARAAIAAVRPGVRPSELFEIAVETVRANGIPDYRRHHTGHGIGIAVYDPPIVQPAQAANIFGIAAADAPLELGTTLNIETPYYAIGDCGFIVEDTMVVREHGAELLTHLDYGMDVR